MDLKTIERFLQQTLPLYVGRKGGRFRLINEVQPRTLFGGLLFQKAKLAKLVGLEFKEKLQFNRAEVGQWVGAAQKIDLRGTRAPSWTSWPARFYRWGHYIDATELDMQDDPEVVLNDLLAQCKEDVDFSIVLALEEAINALDGNYLHDGESADYLRMFGWRHLLTINGLHITHDTSKSIGGINAYTQPLWRNQFLNPVECSDAKRASDTISSIYQLREALAWAFRMLSFQSMGRWGSLARNIHGDRKENPDTGDTKAQGYIIVVDSKTYDQWRVIVDDRRDDLGRDQALLAGVYKGMALEENAEMGIDPTYGYGFDSDGNALWTDEGSNYASAQWKGFGECTVWNTNYIRFLTHGDHDPQIYDAYKPEGMTGVAHEGDFWCQLACGSRRRLGAYLGPFAHI